MDVIAAGLEADQEIEDAMADLIALLTKRGPVGSDTRAGRVLREHAVAMLDFVVSADSELTVGDLS